jgi:hypothetical protein
MKGGRRPAACVCATRAASAILSMARHGLRRAKSRALIQAVDMVCPDRSITPIRVGGSLFDELEQSAPHPPNCRVKAAEGSPFAPGREAQAQHVVNHRRRACCGMSPRRTGVSPDGGARRARLTGSRRIRQGAGRCGGRSLARGLQ